jgi:hypothetical protein
MPIYIKPTMLAGFSRFMVECVFAVWSFHVSRPW